MIRRNRGRDEIWQGTTMATILRELNLVSLGRMFGWNRARFDRELET